MSRRIHIGLGANLGEAKATLTKALAQIEDWANQQEPQADFRCSRLYISTALGGPGPDYINAVAQFNSALGGQEILSKMQAIEESFGRTRPFPNAPRTLDLDLLLIDQESVQSPNLTVPHPRLTERAFVLKPLAELAPDLSLSGQSIQVHLRNTAHQYCEVLEP